MSIGLVVLLTQFSANLSFATPLEDLFGYQSIPQADINDFPQWVSLLEQDFKQTEKHSCDKNAKSELCKLQNWKSFLGSIKDLSPAAQMDAVNNFANKQLYVIDTENYGQDDYWAGPSLFLNNGGDCEDFAIIKMLSLRWLGWSDDALRLVIVQDTDLGIPHAVLAVASDNEVWILDNQTSAVVPQRSLAHYAPVYSLGKQQWWLHRPLG